MKGAIGSAFILDIVITLIIIFFTLIIGSMAYTKAYKIKNFIVNSVEKYEDMRGPLNTISFNHVSWADMVNPYLRESGYIISSKKKQCPVKTQKDTRGVEKEIEIIKNTKIGDYEYCIYKNTHDNRYGSEIHNKIIPIKKNYHYIVLVYMKFDIPVIGKFIKIPITGETRTFYTID